MPSLSFFLISLFIFDPNLFKPYSPIFITLFEDYSKVVTFPPIFISYAIKSLGHIFIKQLEPELYLEELYLQRDYDYKTFSTAVIIRHFGKYIKNQNQQIIVDHVGP